MNTTAKIVLLYEIVWKKDEKANCLFILFSTFLLIRRRSGEGEMIRLTTYT